MTDQVMLALIGLGGTALSVFAATMTALFVTRKQVKTDEKRQQAEQEKMEVQNEELRQNITQQVLAQADAAMRNVVVENARLSEIVGRLNLENGKLSKRVGDLEETVVKLNRLVEVATEREKRMLMIVRSLLAQLIRLGVMPDVTQSDLLQLDIDYNKLSAEIFAAAKLKGA